MPDFYVRMMGDVTGPFTGSQLKKMASNGELNLESEIKKDDGSWVAAQNVKGLSISKKPVQAGPLPVSMIQAKNAKIRYKNLFQVAVGIFLALGAMALFIAVTVIRSKLDSDTPPLTMKSSALEKSLVLENGYEFRSSFGYDRIYVPMNLHCHEAVQFANRIIRVEVYNGVNQLDTTGGLFNIGGNAAQVSCSTNNEAICECYVSDGDAVILTPKAPEKVQISVQLLNSVIDWDIEFVQIPIRICVMSEVRTKGCDLLSAPEKQRFSGPEAALDV